MDLHWITTAFLNFAIVLLSIVIGGGLIAGSIWLLFRWRKYKQFKVIVWEKDGFGQLSESYDEGGIFVDSKTQNKRLFLKKANVGLDADSIPFLPNKVGGKSVVYLFRNGLKNFHYIRPNIDNSKINLSVGEEDVNWAINAYERQKKMFNQNMFLQYLPFIALAFVSIIILIMFIYFFKDFKTLAETAQAMQAAAKALAQAQGGTVVIPS